MADVVTMDGVRRGRAIRYSGLAGAVLLAVAAYFGGARPEAHFGATLVEIWRADHGPPMLGAWLLGTALMTAAWWVSRDRVPSVRWAYLTAGLWLVPLVVAPVLGSRDVYSYACQGDVFAAGYNPYHVSAADLPCQWLDSVSPSWRGTPAPYGPLFVVLAGAAVSVGGSLAVTIALLRLFALVGVGLAMVFVPMLARRCGIPEKRALWLAMACPLVGVHLVSGAHNDALMIGLLVGGLALVSPRSRWHLVGAGVLLGLAVAVKATAAVVVPFAAVAAVAGPGPYRLRGLVRDGGLVVGAAVLAVLAVTLGSGLGFGWVSALRHSGESVQWSSPSTAVGMTVQYAGQPFGAHLDAVPITRAIGLVVLAVVLAALWWRTRPDNALHRAGLALAATVALGPVFHPWYAIWPLAVLAATAARRTRWFAAPCAATCFLALPNGSGLDRFSRLPGALAMTTLVIVVAVAAWRRYDPVRRRPSSRSSGQGSPSQAAGSTAGGT